MSISRDEAREIAVVAVLVAAGLRIMVGVIRAANQLTQPFSARSVLDELFGPVGTTPGILILGAVLLVVLGPTGSVSAGLQLIVYRAAVALFIFGLVSAFYMLGFSYSVFWSRWWVPFMNGLPTAVLAGAGVWILRNFDPDR